MSTYYLVVGRRDLAGFVRAEDREYFSRPVPVTLSHCCVSTRQLYVTDPHRGHTYPIDRKNLKSRAQLTRRQLASV